MIVIRKKSNATENLVAPKQLILLRNDGAANRIRTCDPVITNDVLYQLSYCGGPCGAFGNGAENACP
jgi:hypothetical protein